MLTKNDFTTEEWATLRETPHLVGVATMLSGASGLGTLKESVAAAKLVMEGQSSNFPLIRDLSNREDMKAAQDAILNAIGSGERSVEKIQTLALDRVRQTMELLKTKGASEEAQAVRTWLISLGDGVAKAAKEGGFLGFGGKQVSEGEQAFLTNLNAALGDTTAAAGA